MRTAATEVQKRSVRERDVAAHGCPNMGSSDPCEGDVLEALFTWGAQVAAEQDLTAEKLHAILKRVRDRLRA